MEYTCIQARFRFFNGTDIYTVEYVYNIQTWFIFEGDKIVDALYNKSIDPKKNKTPNRDAAALILDEYLATLR